jgi:gliding motility-associated-like protein
MKKSTPIVVLLTIVSFTIHAQSTVSPTWKTDLHGDVSFVQNLNQFERLGPEDKHFHAACFKGDQAYFFYCDKVIIRFYERQFRDKSEAEKEARKQRKTQPFNTLEEWQAFERAGQGVRITWQDVTLHWDGANTSSTADLTNAATSFELYTRYNSEGEIEESGKSQHYKKLTVHNVYPGIDVVYEPHPESGFKYSLIVHPGADPKAPKLHYDHPFTLTSTGQLETTIRDAKIVDHAPIAFYLGEEQSKLSCAYSIREGSVGFNVNTYNPAKTLVIDPWTQTPTFPSNWDCIWECEADASGNTYIIGGVTPLELKKYNSAGVLQWSFNTPYDTSSWLGVFATDNAGNSFVTQGSTAQILRVNTGGGLVWSNTSPGGLFSSTEFWNIAFNCDQTKLVVGGTGGIIPPLPYLYDINTATGNVITSVQVTGSTIAGFPPNTQEVRAVTATDNQKYYYLTHDSIGFVSDNLSLCPTQTVPFHVENGGYNLSYKNENWRYNNTGVEALAYYNGFVFVNRGNRLDKRDFASAAILQSVTIPGGGFPATFGQNQMENSGIAIDDCGTIFVGSKNGVYAFNQALVQTASYPTSFVVYDVALTSTGEVVAAGSTGNSGSASRTGTVQSFAATACAQPAIICCNPFICDPGPICDTDAPFALQVETPGGTWSISPATAAFNTSTGTFDPGASGNGTWTVTYTLACGSETVDFTVNTCSALSVCIETNGDLTVSGGTGPYTWAYFDPGGTTPITNQTECQACGYTWTFGTCLNGFIPVTSCSTPAGYVDFGTGVTVTPPANNQLQVTDNVGTVFQFDPATLPPCSTTCDPTITPAGPFCEGDPSATLASVDPGGTWSATCGVCINASTGEFNPAVAGAGSWTVTYTLGCGSSDTETITVNADDDPSFSYSGALYCPTDPDPTPTITGTAGGSFSIDNSGVINASTGVIDLSASGTGSFIVTYTTAGSCPATGTFNLTITSAADATITAAGPFCANDPAVTLSAATGGGTWTASCGACITSGGLFDPALATTGANTITYTISGSCGATDNETITVNAAQDASFSFASANYCPTDPNPTPTITGTSGGTFTINNGGSINASTGQINLAASGNGTFTVTYTTAGPCADVQTFVVTISATTDATITAAGPFCANDAPVTLTAATGGGTWTASCGACITTGGVFDPALATIGANTVTYTISGSCGATDNETITVNAAQDATFSYPAAAYCLTDTDPTPTITGTTGGIFTISGTGVINAGTGVVDLSASGAGNFTVTYTTAGPCADVATFGITISNSFDPTITAAGPFCDNAAPAQLTAASAGGTWSATCGSCISAGGLFDPAQAGAGSHTITYTIAGSCGGTDTQVIVVNASDDASFSYPASTFCASDADPVASVSGTAGGVFTISGGAVINASTGLIDLSASGAGTFIVTYTSAGLCPDSQTFTVTVNTAANVIITNVGPYCLNDAPVNLSASPPGGTWSGTGITDAVTGTFDPTVAGIGSSYVSYTISGSCGDADSILVTVLPVPTISAGNDTIVDEGGTISLNGSPNGTSVIWSGPGGFVAISSDPTIAPATLLNAGAYVITTTGSNGCTATDTVLVFITDLDQEIWVPNIFSPNGDGNNDFFFVRGDGLNGFNLKIFNRWGEMIFESIAQTTPWDGTQNGRKVDSGVYVYMITYTDVSGTEQVISGNVMVVQY